MEPTDLTVLANKTIVLFGQLGRLGVIRMYARVRATAANPIASTSTSATTGSPTNPGPCPELRGSPPGAAVGLGDAAIAKNATVNHVTDLVADPQPRARAARARVPAPAVTRAMP